MGDKHHRHAALALQLGQDIEDFSLNGDVERRGRFVGDQHVGVIEQGDGDHHPLAHAPGKLVRVLPHPPVCVGDRHTVEHLHAAPSRFRPVQAAVVGAQGLHHLGADVEVGVEAGHRVLKHHGDPLAADGVEGPAVQIQQVMPVEDHLALGAGVIGEQAQRRHPRL